MVWGALHFDKAPVSGYHKEEVQPGPGVEPHRKPKFDLGASVIFGEHKGVRVDILSFLPAAPMPDCFPHKRRRALAEEKPKEAHNHNGQLLNAIAVDIDINEKPNERACADKACPVPLPSSSNRKKSFRSRYIGFAMFGQHRKSKHQRNTVSDGECDANVATGLYWINSVITRGRVDECSVGQKVDGLVRLECQVAVGPIGHCSIAVVTVVEMLQRGQRQTNATENGFILFGAGIRPVEKISRDEFL